MMQPILLVEDSPADAERITRFLRRKKDLTLHIAVTGAEALEALGRQPFAYLILDYRLPDTNGLELLQTVRRQFPDLRVILLTGFDDDRLFVSASKLGAVAALSKDRLSEPLLHELIQNSAAPIESSEKPVGPLSLPPAEVYRTLIETMNEGMIVADPHQIIIFVNPRMGEIAGCPAADLLGRKLPSLITPSSLPSFLKEWGKSLSGETRRYECEIASAAEGPLSVLISQTPSSHREGNIYGCLLVVTDISRQKSIERRLEQLSITDGLTGLFNRRHFEALLGIEFQKSSRHRLPLSCLMLDLDHFKECNDTLGHLFGDAVLRESAQLIRKEIRSHDILARYGGEEFVLLLPNIPATAAIEVGERIRKSIAHHPFVYDGKAHRMTVSIGIAGTEDTRITLPETLIRFADRALYQAKGGGRNRVCLQRD
jgi:diguanylate cyclase (GGDEF)-like protein/PAS domain S-box-containing protein